jgi:hypothetical protein
MAPARLLDHLVRERGGVIRADEPERVGGRERQVDERLVQLALRELVGRPLSPDRLADPAHAAAVLGGVVGNEAAPSRDDARGVAADHLDVRELHVVRALAKRLAEERELPRPHHRQHRLAAVETLLGECAARGDEVLVAVVEKRLVMEGRGGSHRGPT